MDLKFSSVLCLWRRSLLGVTADTTCIRAKCKICSAGLITQVILNYRDYSNESSPWCYPPGKCPMRLVPTMVTFESFGPPAQNIDVHVGMCPSLHKWIDSKFTSRKKIAVDIKEREGPWRGAFEVKHIGKAPAEMQPPHWATLWNDLPFWLLQSILHSFDLLEVTGHISSQHHLND